MASGSNIFLFIQIGTRLVYLTAIRAGMDIDPRSQATVQT